jgi:CMP-N-acetylneuraminic acid synthetase
LVVGLIPARKGSKGVPNKNLRLVFGKPLIVHAIECGLQCEFIDHLIVSTNCKNIATVARDSGAEVPFMRPKELATDEAPMLPVLEHAVLKTEEHYAEQVNCLILLDPTAPLRRLDDLIGAFDLFRNEDCGAVVSGSVAQRNPYFNMVQKKSTYYTLVNNSMQTIGRRQDAPLVYDLNTVVWIYSRAAVLKQGSRIPEKTLLYEIPVDRAIDLDTELDFDLLDFILSRKKPHLDVKDE